VVPHDDAVTVTTCPELPVNPDSGRPEAAGFGFRDWLVFAGNGFDEGDGLLGVLVGGGFAAGTVIIVRAVTERVGVECAFGRPFDSERVAVAEGLLGPAVVGTVVDDVASPLACSWRSPLRTAFIEMTPVAMTIAETATFVATLTMDIGVSLTG
jgi:hypothetical protein